jgi:hypothetical protein
MKKLVLLVVFALSMLATGTTQKADAPFPACDPCPGGFVGN